jgi:hypothetical protein
MNAQTVNSSQFVFLYVVSSGKKIAEENFRKKWGSWIPTNMCHSAVQENTVFEIFNLVRLLNGYDIHIW